MCIVEVIKPNGKISINEYSTIDAAIFNAKRIWEENKHNKGFKVSIYDIEAEIIFCRKAI